MSKLTLKTEGDRYVVGTRRFNASPEAVYRAHLEPNSSSNGCWAPKAGRCPFASTILGREANSVTNGRTRSAAEFHITGEFVELTPFSRIVHVERMHLPDPTPDNHVVTTFEKDGSGTLMTLRMTLPDAASRAAMLATGMEHGMEASYVRLDAMA